MRRKINLSERADAELAELGKNPKFAGVFKQVLKTLALLETDTKHPGLRAHKFTSMKGAGGEEVFEAYAQNNTPGAYRVFWHYGPDETAGKKRIPVISIPAVTPHP